MIYFPMTYGSSGRERVIPLCPTQGHAFQCWGIFMWRDGTLKPFTPESSFILLAQTQWIHTQVAFFCTSLVSLSCLYGHAVTFCSLVGHTLTFSSQTGYLSYRVTSELHMHTETDIARSGCSLQSHCCEPVLESQNVWVKRLKSLC